MSAYDIKSDPLQEQFGSLQIECFISKPIEISELIKILETELAISGSSSTINSRHFFTSIFVGDGISGRNKILHNFTITQHR